MNVRLELNTLKLNRPKERWDLYFIFATEHPIEENEWVVTVFSQNGQLIKLRNASDNMVQFKPKGNNTEGLFVLEREMPKDMSLKARMWVMHSRKSSRKIGEILQELGTQITGNGVAKTLGVLGAGLPWVAASKGVLKGLGVLGDKLSELKDRDLGFVSMDEDFNGQSTREERSNSLSTGYGEISWSWIMNN